MALQHIVVLGGSGFVGRYVVARLAAAGHRVVVPDAPPRTRQAPHPAADGRRRRMAVLRPGDAAQSALAGATRGHQSRRHPQRNRARSRSRARMSSSTRELVAACRQQGVRRLLQMSALDADPAGPTQVPAHQGRGRGHRRRRRASRLDDLSAVGDLRPRTTRSSICSPRLTRIAAGRGARLAGRAFQPVHVGDVAHCFVQALGDDVRDHRPALRPCAARKVYTLRELVALRRRGDGRACARS